MHDLLFHYYCLYNHHLGDGVILCRNTGKMNKTDSKNNEIQVNSRATGNLTPSINDKKLIIKLSPLCKVLLKLPASTNVFDS